MRFILFSATWCTVCPAMKRMAEEASRMTEIPVEVVDVERAPEDLTDLAQSLVSVPVLAAVLPGGQVLRRIEGLVPINTLVAFLQDAS